MVGYWDGWSMSGFSRGETVKWSPNRGGVNISGPVRTLAGFACFPSESWNLLNKQTTSNNLHQLAFCFGPIFFLESEDMKPLKQLSSSTFSGHRVTSTRTQSPDGILGARTSMAPGKPLLVRHQSWIQWIMQFEVFRNGKKLPWTNFFLFFFTLHEKISRLAVRGLSWLQASVQGVQGGSRTLLF